MSGNKQKQKQKQLVQNLVFTTGIIIMGVGAFGLASPQTYASLFEGDLLVTQIFSGALVVAGLGDLIIAKIVLKTKDRL